MASSRGTRQPWHRRFAHGHCTAYELGLMIAAWNVFIFAVLFMLALLNTLFFSVWLVLIIPAFFTIYWLWISQHILMVYHNLRAADMVRISLTAALPFAYLAFLAALFIYLPGLSQAIALSDMRLLAAGLLSSLGLALLCPTVVLYGLQHRIIIHHVRVKKSSP